MGFGRLRRWGARMRRGTARPRLAVLATLTLLAAICPALQVARPAPASASVASPRVTGQPGHAAGPAGAALVSSHATLIAAGNAHSCVIQSGQAYCWGSNSNGQLGDGSTSSTTSPVPVYTGGVLAGRTLTQIVAGASSTCALDSTGLAYCWGLDSSGQLGNNSTTQSPVPVAVSTSGVLAGKTLVQLAAGNAHVCALDSTGAAYCWGSNGGGQLGNNSTTKSLVPVAVTTSGVLSGVTLTQITAGYAHTCAVSSAGAAYCWGANGNGQLGNSSTTLSLVPVAVTTSGVLSGVTLVQISSDQLGQYTCALSAAGGAYCWGAASFGQLGNGGSSTPGVPVAVSTSGVLSGVTLVQIATGSGTTCALSAGGAGYCWGQDVNGELGNNSTTSTTVPVAVTTFRARLGGDAGPGQSGHQLRLRAGFRERRLLLGAEHLGAGGQPGHRHALPGAHRRDVSVHDLGWVRALLHDQERPGVLLGRQHLRRAGQRHHHQQQHPGRGVHLGRAVRGDPHPDHRGLLLHLRAEQHGQRVLLGP